MKNSVIIAGVLVVIFIAGYLLLLSSNEAEAPAEDDVNEPAENVNRGEASFTWKYQTVEMDSVPNTKISLEARYSDGTTATWDIDEVEGSCNDYPEPDEDVYSESTMIICYYAGLGHYFKVVEEGEGYVVRRRIFEEASPEYDPPTTSFETIKRL